MAAALCHVAVLFNWATCPQFAPQHHCCLLHFIAANCHFFAHSLQMPATAGPRARRDEQNGAAVTPAPTINPRDHPAGLDTHATDVRARFAPANNNGPALANATPAGVDDDDENVPLANLVAFTRNDTVRDTLTALSSRALHECPDA